MKKDRAFTMAEILISLTIIGVIAAITLPALVGNINESAWSSQRKAFYSRMSQALSMLPSLNGYGIALNTDGTINYTVTNEKAATTFVTDGLSKVLKINNICDSTNLSKCGIPDKITPMSSAKMDFPKNLTELNPMFTSTYTYSNSNYTNPQKDINTNVAAFETGNGESVAIFYNPLCQADMEETASYYTQTKMCANFVYDLNGKKGPNKVGKDIGFITAIYSTDSNIVAPITLYKNYAGAGAHDEISALCRAKDRNSRVPNRDELSAMFYNRRIIGKIDNNGLWSSTVGSSDENYAWYQNFNTGKVSLSERTNTISVRCIKR